MGTQHHGPKDRHSMTTLRHLPDFKLERYFAPLEFTAPYHHSCSSEY
jgi:hypothetical protein